MFHYVNSIQNTRGDALIGYFVQLVSPTTSEVVDIYADDNGTPIVTESGIVNMAEVDSDGNASFFVESGSYHINIYATDGTTFLKQIANVPMITPGDFVTGADLADTGGAALVGTSDGGTVQEAVDRIGTFAGYDTGVGGAVAQATSKTTAVTINALCGQITLHIATLASGAVVSFDVNNSYVDVNDVVVLNARGGSFATGQSYEYRVDYVQEDLFRVFFKNISASPLAEAVSLNFAVIKGANS